MPSAGGGAESEEVWLMMTPMLCIAAESVLLQVSFGRYWKMSTVAMLLYSHDLL